MLSCSSKNSIIMEGGLLDSDKSLSAGKSVLYWIGKSLIINSNLSRSPYFSFIGNLGSSYLSLFKSITPECWPNAKSNLLEIYFFWSKLYSPKG